MRDCVLALDLGTTGNRAVVFDRGLRAVASSYREFPQRFPRPGWVEHDPEDIWRTARACLADVLRRCGGRVAAIGLTNQRETTVLWDRETSRPLHNAIVWQDRRTAAACETLKRRGHQTRVRRSTGLFLDPYFSATKLRWLLDESARVRSAVGAGRAAFGTVDSWLLWKLTGGRVHATDPSNASRTLLCSLSGDWDSGLRQLFGVPSGLLPQIRPTAGFFGTTDPRLVGVELPILAMAGDQQAALFGQGGFSPGVAKNTYGTGLFVMVNTGDRPAASRRLLSTIAWKRDGRLSYALEGSVFVGGSAVQWLRDGLGLIKKASEVEALAGSVPDSGGVTFVPALTGLGAPHWDPHARGAFFGLTRGTTRGHLARAALEALALQTVEVVREMESATGRAVKRLQVDGGACANDLLMQLQADFLGVEVERPAILESTALGAAGLAGIAAGLWKSPADFASRRRVDRLFRPRLGARQREAALERWRWAVSRTLIRG